MKSYIRAIFKTKTGYVLALFETRKLIKRNTKKNSIAKKT